MSKVSWYSNGVILNLLLVVFLMVGCNQGELDNQNTSPSGIRSKFMIDSLIELSEEYYKSTEFNDSIFDKYLFQADSIAEQSNLIESQANIYRIVGRRFRNLSAFGESLYFYHKVLEIANQVENDSLKAYAKHEMAVVFRRIDDNSKALNYHFQALQWAESVSDTFLILASNNGIGNVYYNFNNLPKAIQYYQHSLKLLKNGFKNKLSEAINTNNIGEAYLELGNADSALFFQNESYRLNLEMSSLLGQAICENGMGDIYIYLKQYEHAIEHYQKSLLLNQKVGNKIYLVNNYLNLGKTYFIVKNYPLAKMHLEQAYVLAKELGSKSKIVEALQNLAILLSQNGRNDLALELLQEAMVYKDTITDEVSHLNSDGATALYKLEKQEREIVILKQNNQLNELRVNRQRWVLLATTVTILGVVIFSFYVVMQRKRNVKFTKQIQLQHKNINGSIKYAQRIQMAVLPDLSNLKEIFNNYFIFYKPRDMVSGDFYWYAQRQQTTLLAVVDCTGHGVPGALMSMLGVTLLNDIVNGEGITQPDLILNKLRSMVIEQLKQKGGFEDTKDGMEMAVMAIDNTTLELEYAGAYCPLYIVRNQKLIQLKADRQPIGFHPTKKGNFTLKQVQLFKNDVLYCSTDGFYDQFGGGAGTKFMIKNFLDFLLEISQLPMDEQSAVLEHKLSEWQGEYEQIDDITILGLKV